MAGPNLSAVNNLLELTDNGNIGDVITRTGPLTVGWVTPGVIPPTPGATLLKAVAVLTNAQLLALPSTFAGHTVVAAPGVGFMLVPAFAQFLYTNTTGAFLGNVDGACTLGLYYAGNLDQATTLLNNSPNSEVDNLIDVGISSLAVVQQNLTIVPNQGNGIPELDDRALVILTSNNGSGDFTGGAAADTLTVTTYYYAIPT